MGHFQRMNQILGYSSVVKVFIPESNLANEASHMVNMIKAMPDVRTFWQRDDRPGVHKSHAVTDDYQFMFDSKLKTDSLHFDSNFFTTTPGKTEREIKGLAREQLERYHIEFQDAHDVYGRAKQVITGKMGPGMQDDLAIAILMGPYWGRLVLKNRQRLR